MEDDRLAVTPAIGGEQNVYAAQSIVKGDERLTHSARPMYLASRLAAQRLGCIWHFHTPNHPQGHKQTENQHMPSLF